MMYARDLPRSGASRGAAPRRLSTSLRAAGACGLAAALLVAAGCDGDLGGGAAGAGAGSGTGGSGAGTTTGAGGYGGATFTTGTGSGGGSTGAGGAGNCGSVLQGIVRDFQDTHPDFEGVLGDDKGIVLPDLGADGKPVYAGNPTTPTTNGQQYFDQWYRDTPGVNMPLPLAITLADGGSGVYTYESSAFFPIDDQGFGNQGRVHNYHFTLELRTQFKYEGGEVFTFTGDDDLFTFINGKLAIDLGGVHGAESATVDLDARAAELGISIGGTYALDFFFAERHTSESNFRIDTTINCFSEPPPPD